jgi:periplasmic copper chaperone A
MKAIRLLAALPVILFSAEACAELLVDNAWVRGLPPGVANASAYMTLTNTGNEDIVLTGASSPIAGSVLLHSTMNHDGMLHMTEVETLTIPAGAEVRLESGGTHLMLTALKQTPTPGTDVELTLEFADGETRALQLPVRSVLDE